VWTVVIGAIGESAGRGIGRSPLVHACPGGET
jgi:hypothetical protein